MVVKKVLGLASLGVLGVSLAACGGGSSSSNELKINFTAGNTARHITYSQENPLILEDGTTISDGDLKPTWQFYEEELGIEVNDTSVSGQKGSEMISTAAANNFANSDIYGSNGITENFMSYGANNGSFINLSDHLDDMPDYKKYLEDNPLVEAYSTAYDGNMYHVAYQAEVGAYARTFNARTEWVKVLLDDSYASSRLTETDTLEVEYTAFYDQKTNNVIQDQAGAAGSDGLDFTEARDALLAHISAEHPGFTNPSELYVGDTAVYDIDELVALWRVMKLAPNTLSSFSNGGTAVSDAEIVPFFVRQQSYRDDILRIANYFDGQRVFGADSYASRFYLDNAGDLQFSHSNSNFLDGLDKIKTLYNEGLIHQDTNDESLASGGSIRSAMFSQDYADAHKQFGFMTFDWIASTTNTFSENSEGEREYKIEGILPPMTTLEGEEGMVHWVDNGRAIKPDGWAIASHVSGAKLQHALDLFNYMFTEEGIKVQNYGTPDMWDGTYEAAQDGETYTKVTDWVLESAEDLKNGDASAFLRDYVGSILPIGYVKEIGLEYQYTSENGTRAWALYNDNDVLFPTYTNDNDMLNMSPAIFSFESHEQDLLAEYNIGEEQQDQIFLYITGSENGPKDQQDVLDTYGSNLTQYIGLYRTAYDRMLGN